MKTTYSTIVLFLIGMFAISCNVNATKKNQIVLQSEKTVSQEVLTHSAKVITNRLTDYHVEDFNVTVIAEKNQIQVEFNDAKNLAIIESMLIQKGAISFNETLTCNEISDLLPSGSQLFSLLNSEKANSENSYIGTISTKEARKVNNYLNTLEQNQDYRFVWQENPEKSENSLFALNCKNGDIAGNDAIKDISVHQNETEGYIEIKIQFNQEAAHTWAEATQRSTGKAIAIVLDNNVLAAPIVQSTIQGGVCVISGNFTEEEARRIVALAKNGILSANFKIVR